MSLVLNDRVLETCTSPGTGSCTLLGATTGFRTFSAGVGNGNTCYYTIADQNGGNWEVGLGTYTSSSNSLARTTVLSSSNSGSLVNFNSGTQNVFVTYPAEKAVYLDASGNVTLAGNLTAGSINTTPIGNSTPSTGAFTDFSASGTITLSGGTANGVLYLNGSKAVTSGTALSFDGTNLSTTGNIISSLGHYAKGTFGATYTDGIVLDYITGLGRISVGSSDGLSIYNGGVGGTALLNLDSSGNLGLGVTPSVYCGGRSLNVGNTSSGTFAAVSLGGSGGDYGGVGYNLGWQTTTGQYKYLTTDTSSWVQFAGGGFKFWSAPSGTAGNAISFTQAMTLDASGNLGVGTTSPAARLHVYSTAAVPAQITSTQATSYLQINSSGGSSGIASAGDGLVFFTSQFGTERARIDSSGNLLINTTDVDAGVNGNITNTQFSFRAASEGFRMSCTGSSYYNVRNTGLTNYIYWRYAGSTVGTIAIASTSTAYNTSSDQRLKTNVTPAGSAIQSILDFPVDQFDWISTGEHQDFGAVAQKAINVIPEMVSVPADEDEMWGIDWSKANPRLIRAFQEQHQMILAMRDELDQLKATLH